LKTGIYIYEIIEFLGKEVISVIGNKDICITHLRDYNNVDASTLDWVNPGNNNKQQLSEQSNALAIIVDEDIIYSQKHREKGIVLIYVKNPKLALAKVGSHFFEQKYKPAIHPTAVIHPEAKIGNEVYIGPNTTIGNCSIGNNCIIFGNAFISDNVVLQNKVEIHNGVSLGNEAHNFIRDKNNSLVKFPHLGSLIIGNDVVIGANSAISRGVLGDTTIGSNTKIAQLVFIGSNNQIGNSCVIRPNVMTSGSVVIKNNAIIAPSATIRDHITIGTNAFIGMGAVVTKNVPANETWMGNPAKPYCI